MINLAPPVDITPVSTPPHYREYGGGGRTPLSDRDVSSSPTYIFSYKPHLGHFTISSTPTQSDVLREHQQLISNEAEKPISSNIDEIRDSRISLLVQKYEGAATSEDSARLDILTQRLRRLSPRSAPDELDMITVMVDKIEQVSDNIKELKAKYKIA